MDKLALIPDAPGYSDKAPDEVISVMLDGGASRFRRDKINARKMVTLSWTLNPLEYRYFMAFFTTAVKRGALPFLCDLVSEDGTEPVEHECNFVPGSVGLSSQSGLTYVMSAQLEVKPIEHDEAVDSSLVLLYGLYGAGMEAIMAQVAMLANETMPDALA
jgi:hypothetical protein